MAALPSRISTSSPLIIVFIFLSHITAAQLDIGVRVVGLQFSSFTNKIGMYTDKQNKLYKNKTSFGALGGLSVKYNLHTRSYIHVELLYSMRGERYSYNTSQLDGSPVVSFLGDSDADIEYYIEYRTNYIEIPIMYCIDLSHGSDFPVHFFLSSGLSTGINVSSKLHQNSFKVRSPGWGYSAIDEDVKKTDIPSANKFLLNFIGDLEAEVNRGRRIKFFFFARYNSSLTNVYTSQESDPQNMKTRLNSFSFGAGLRSKVGYK